MAMTCSARVLLLVLVALSKPVSGGDTKEDSEDATDDSESTKEAIEDAIKDDSDDSTLLDFLKKHGEKRELARCIGDTRFEGKKNICQHEGFRFCMRLTDGDGPYIFGDRDSENATEKEEDVNKDGLDWWEWSTQPQHKESWMAGILATGGHNWCTCALCTSEAVDRFGCDNLDIQCNATDVAFIRYRVEHDKHMVLNSAWQCLKKKCGEDYQKDWPIVGHDCKKRGCARLYENSLMPVEALEDSSRSIMAMAASAVGFVALFAGLSLWRRRAAGVAAKPPLLAVEAEEEMNSALE